MQKRICTIRILDEVNCVVLGLVKGDAQVLVKQFRFHPENYNFNPKYQLGAWDGYIEFFKLAGKTYVNFLADIIPMLVHMGYKMTVEDLRQTPTVEVPPITNTFFSDRGVASEFGEPWIIRDYQVDMVNALIADHGGVGIAGTGAGKTSMTAALALSYELAASYRSMIIVPDKNLTDQTFTEYKKFGLDVGQFGGGIKDGDHQHVVSTWQTLKNYPSFIQEFKVVIVDEAHGLRGNVLQDILNNHGKNIPFRFGVTGTLPKNKCDAASIRATVGEVKFEIPAHKLQEMNYLANLHIDIIQHEFEFKEDYQDYLDSLEDDEKPLTYQKFADDMIFDGFAAEKRWLQGSDDRTQDIADRIIAMHNNHLGNVLCLVNGVAYGRKLATMIPDAIFLSGKDSMTARKEAYNLFKDRDDVTVIATVNIASTGLDIPRIFQLVGVDMGKSFIRTIQTIGRGLRKAADKDNVTYTDICSNLKYSRRHLTDRKKYFKEAKYNYKLQKVKLDKPDTDAYFR